MFWRKRKIETEQVEDLSVFNYDYIPSRVLYKSDFEDGLKDWTPRTPGDSHVDYGKYETKISITTEERHSGSQCMKIEGRQRGWNGASLDITKYLKERIQNYEIMVWVKLREDAKSCRVHLSIATLEMLCGVEVPMFNHIEDYGQEQGILTKYRLPVGTAEKGSWDANYPEGYATDDGWVLLRGKINIRKADYSQVYIYIETNGDLCENVLYVDDFVLLSE
jgi:hypothetical protein